MSALYDCHTHIGIELGHYLTGAYPYCQHYSDLCSQLDTAGIDRVVVFPMVSHLHQSLSFLDPRPTAVTAPVYRESGERDEPCCSFCGRPRSAVRDLVTGGADPDRPVRICDECVAVSSEVIGAARAADSLGGDRSRFPYEFENRHFLAEIYDLFGDLAARAVPFAMIDPSRQQSQQIEHLQRLAERYPIAGLKLQGTMIQSPVRDLPGSGFLHLAQERDWPVLIHSAVHPDDPWSQVSDILDVVEAWPAVRFNVAHTLRFDAEGLERLATLPNAWFDVSAFCIHCDLAAVDSVVVAPSGRRFVADYERPGQALRSFAEAYPDRMLWGSDAPYYSYVATFTLPDGRREHYDLRSSMARETAALRSLPQSLIARVAGANPRAWLYGDSPPRKD